MRRVEPKVFLVAETALQPAGLSGYLEHVGAPNWDTDATTPGEVIVEVMGRLCYCSFEPGLNANVTRVRVGNKAYLENILNSRHGSVLEHASASFVFADVSRVFTHELVRHRAGTAFSQESLRYVRLTDLGLWLPPEIEARPDVVALFEETFRSLEAIQTRLSEVYGLDAPGANFETKKKVTSAMRRGAPIGLATTIGATFNMRALRHVLELRTDGAAEAEMRLVIGRLGEIATARWPAIFQDFERKEDGAWKPKYGKV